MLGLRGQTPLPSYPHSWQREDQQSAARGGLDVGSSGCETADILLAVFPKPRDGYGVHVHAGIRDPELFTRARIKCPELAINRCANENEPARRRNGSTVCGGSSGFGHA